MILLLIQKSRENKTNEKIKKKRGIKKNVYISLYALTKVWCLMGLR